MPCFVACVESEVELAVQHAADVARARRRALACITLRGGPSQTSVKAHAEAVLRRLGIDCDEVIVEGEGGSVRLASLELRR